MTKPLVFEKPLGMRDILPESLAKQRHLEFILRSRIEQWGYDEIATPSLEYYDTVGAASATLTDRMFKLLDKQGHTVVLRPDMTTPIARVVSSLYKDVAFPIRLFYQTNVFRAQEKEAGRNAEFHQTGIELIGDASVDADAEAIALAISCLKEVGVGAFKVAIGHVDFIDGLLDEIVPDQEAHSKFKRFLNDRDYVGYRQLIDALTLSEQDRYRLHALLSLRGGQSKISEAYELTVNGKARKAVETLASLWSILEAHGVTEYVLLDFNLISSLNYYTGIVFEGYAADLGSPLVGGGRYDHLLEQFGRPAPATGFAIKMDRLMQITSVQPKPKPSRVAIFYVAARREEAIKKARSIRESGKNVMIQMLEDQTILDEWKKRDDYQIVCLGEQEEVN
ncbi:ATP phosphoribosyltransferase regulatory subunit [Brevibacillus sp. SYSU BS000544]|uniref:ATP phosphoribosyltransferase regulatory subunit n=1 Tax=Brevibacillus sp. SYSU BS000544 TaxID=3416443 RepID=UPI003CE45F98